MQNQSIRKLNLRFIIANLHKVVISILQTILGMQIPAFTSEMFLHLEIKIF